MFGIATGESDPKKPATVGGFYNVVFAANGEILPARKESGRNRCIVGERKLGPVGLIGAAVFKPRMLVGGQ